MNGLEALEALKSGAAIVRVSPGISTSGRRSEYRYRGGRLESRQPDGRWGDAGERVDLFLSPNIVWGMAAYNLPFVEAMALAGRGSTVESETGCRYRYESGELRMLVGDEWVDAELSKRNIQGMWKIHVESDGSSRTI